jgi:hypothetical protein
MFLACFCISELFVGTEGRLWIIELIMPQKKAHYTSLMHPIESVIAFSKAKAIAVLKFNQQDDSDRTFSRQSDRTFKV